MIQEVLKQNENEYNRDVCGCRKEFWTLKIKGINYWHIVRMSVFELVQGKGEHIGQAHPDHNLEMSFKEKQEWALRFSEFFV